MTSEPANLPTGDDNMKEILTILKSLQLNQTIMTSHINVVTTQVNTLTTASKYGLSINQIDPPAAVTPLVDDDAVPPSPSLPASILQEQVDGAGSKQLAHARTPSVTSRIILT